MLSGDMDHKKNRLNWAWRDSNNFKNSFSRKVSGSGNDNKFLTLPLSKSLASTFKDKPNT
jgi:beta-mannanase